MAKSHTVFGDYKSHGRLTKDVSLAGLIDDIRKYAAIATKQDVQEILPFNTNAKLVEMLEELQARVNKFSERGANISSGDYEYRGRAKNLAHLTRNAENFDDLCQIILATSKNQL